MNTTNRLQFRHHDHVFDTREAAIEYIQSQIRFTEEGLAKNDPSYGYSLFAEPTILRYVNEEDETNPHVILVIGSVTNNGTQYSDNKFCIIDIDKTEQEIADLEEEIGEAVKSLTLITKDTDTLKLYAEKTDEGTYVSGDVKVAESHIFDDVRKNNNLMVTPEGLFLYVNLTYDEDTEIFTFTVNNSDGTLSETSVKLPNNYVTSGYYSVQDQSIHLKMKESEDIVIDCKYLISEWDVEGDEAKSPIILTKEEVDFDVDDNSRLKPWQDVLRADVRIKDESFDQNGKPVYDSDSVNILRRTNDKKYLFVDGKASNIVYYMDGQKSNVKEALDKLGKIKLSSDYSNILQEKTDGFFASAKLNYISKENTLVFKVSNQEETRIKLNSFRLFENVYYDSTKEALIITYIDGNDELQIVEIPIGQMLDEWEVFNEGHNVYLDKSQHSVEGKDILTADVKIFQGHNNILTDTNHTLYVRGEADNIKYLSTGTTTVKDVLDELKAEDARIDSKLDDEIARAEAEEQRINAKLDQEIADRITDVDEEQARAEAAEKVLTDKIGTGFTDDPHDNVTYKFEQLQDQVNSEAEKLQNEIDRSEAKDTEHDGRLDAIDAEIGEGFGSRNTVRDEIDNLQAEIDAVSADSSSRLSDVINEDESIDVETRDDANGKPTIKAVKVNLSSEIEDGKPNIIKLNADGLYAGVDLSYAEEANKLIFKTTNGTKEIQLESMSSIISIEYNPTKEAIVIRYMTNGHEIKTVEIPVGDLINEWRVEDGHPHAVQLEKVRIASGTSEQDVLKASVIITDAHEDNMLVMDNGALYVSNSEIVANAAAIDALEDRMDTAEADIDALQEGLREETSARTLAVDAEKNRATSAETALRTAVNDEATRAISEEARIEAKLNTEISTARENENRTETALNDEISRAQATELDIREDLTAETLRAQAADNELYQKIADESADRVAGDSSLREAITNETNRAQLAETNLGNDIGVEHDRAVVEEGRIERKLDNEIARSTAKDDTLNDKINTETTRATAAETTLSDRISAEERRASAEELGLKTSLTAEVTRALSAETALHTADNTLTTNLANEVARATAAEAAIQTQVDANKLAFHDTTTIDLVRTEGNPDIVEGHVKIATSNNNIIRVDESSYGIYASVDLTYDSGTNVLTFTASDGTNKNIELSSGSVIHRAWFDPSTEELILEFVNPDGSFYEVKIPVGSLFNQWDVDNENSKGIKLIKTPGTGSGSTDLLSAEVKISQADDNILMLKDNHLYASGSGITKALSDSEVISGNLETLRTAVNGTNEGYAYPSHATSHIISAATSYDEADMLLDEAFYNMIEKWFLLGFETCTTHTGVKEVAQNRHMYVDVRMSHGNKATGMTDGELSMTDMDDKYFSDTNVLRYINVTETRDHQHLEPNNGYNGMYLSNYWDCGKYYQDSTEGAQIAEMVNEGFEVYNTNYKTDEDEDASGYNYMNNMRLNPPQS